MKHIAYLCAGFALLTACTGNNAYRKVENGLVAEITSGSAKAVKLEVVSDNIIRVIASPDGQFTNEVNLIKDSRAQLPTPAFRIETAGDTILLSTATTVTRLARTTGEVRFTDPEERTLLAEQADGGKSFSPIEVEGTKGYTLRQVFANQEGEALYGLG